MVKESGGYLRFLFFAGYNTLLANAIKLNTCCEQESELIFTKW